MTADIHENAAVDARFARLQKVQKTNTHQEAALKEACAGFEAIFMKKIMESMRQTLPGDALFQESNAMNIYESMHDQHLVDQVSVAPHALGVKEFLFQELKKSL